MALIDVDMTGVKASGEYQELGIGQYLVCIRDTDKKATKEKFDANGAPDAGNGKNFYLQMSLQIEDGPDRDRIEFVRLNLWNLNPTAVNIAKAELKAIQEATGIYSADSTHFHGKYMLLNVKLDSKGNLKRHYEKAPASMIAHLPQAGTYTPPQQQPATHAPAAAPHAAPAQPITHHRPAQTMVHTAQAAAPADPNATPSWARRP